MTNPNQSQALKEFWRRKREQSDFVEFVTLDKYLPVAEKDQKPLDVTSPLRYV